MHSIGEYRMWREQMQTAGIEYSQRISSLRRDISTLSSILDRVCGQTGENRVTQQHRALDRVPLVDRLKEVYKVLDNIQDGIRPLDLLGMIDEYKEYPSVQIQTVKGPDRNSEDVNKLPSAHPPSSKKKHQTGPIIDLCAAVDTFSADLREGIVKGQNPIGVKNILENKTAPMLQNLIDNQLERNKKLAGLRDKLLEYASKAPYS